MVTVEVGPETGLKNPFGVAFDDEGGMYIAEYKGGRLWRLQAQPEGRQGKACGPDRDDRA